MIQVNKLQELLDQGKTQCEIARELGVTQAAISWVRKNKLKLPPAISPTKLFVDEVQELYNSGLSQPQIAKKLNSTSANVSTFMKRHGIKVRPLEIRQLRGEACPQWSKNPTYMILHNRLRNIKGTPNKCETCGDTSPNQRYEWASMNKKYDDFNDYKRLCVLCHRRLDKGMTIPLETLLTLRAKGQTQEEIAKQFNCTRSTISSRLRVAGHFGRVSREIFQS